MSRIIQFTTKHIRTVYWRYELSKFWSKDIRKSSYHTKTYLATPHNKWTYRYMNSLEIHVGKHSAAWLLWRARWLFCEFAISSPRLQRKTHYHKLAELHSDSFTQNIWQCVNLYMIHQWEEDYKFTLLTSQSKSSTLQNKKLQRHLLNSATFTIRPLYLTETSIKWHASRLFLYKER